MMSLRSLVRPAVAATLTFAALGCLGCNAPGERDHVEKLSYPIARGYDFLDMFEFNVAGGVGLHAAVEITPIRLTYGYYDVTKMGTMGRSCGVWDEVRKEAFVAHTFLYWQKQPCVGNGFLFDPDELHRECKHRDPDDHSRRRFYEEWDWTTRYEDWERPWLDLGVEAHALFVGAELAFSPQEAADFFLGLMMVDSVSHDDWAPAMQNAAPVGIAGQGAPIKLEPPHTSPPPGKR